MPSGAYLVIEHTEAMHVIDVNSGHKVTTGDQAECGSGRQPGISRRDRSPAEAERYRRDYYYRFY